MKNTIKLFSMVILALSMMMAGTVSAQTTNEKETQKEIYKKPSKLARKLEKVWMKEGWRSMGMPIANQLDRGFLKQYEKTSDGSPRYITFHGEVSGNTFLAAQSMLDNVAKARIAGSITNSVASLVDVELHNKSLSAEEAYSITKSLESVKVLVAQKLGRTIKTVEVFQILNNGNYKVRVWVHYDIEAAAALVRNALLDELEKEGELNKETLENALGLDKFSKQFATDFDEVLE